MPHIQLRVIFPSIRVVLHRCVTGEGYFDSGRFERNTIVISKAEYVVCDESVDDYVTSIGDVDIERLKQFIVPRTNEFCNDSRFTVREFDTRPQSDVE